MLSSLQFDIVICKMILRTEDWGQLPVIYQDIMLAQEGGYVKLCQQTAIQLWYPVPTDYNINVKNFHVDRLKVY